MAESDTAEQSTTLFGDDGAQSYRVLARKYRPSSFAELIGQDPMVQTLTNAFSSGRIAQAFMLTGVRGVGKTTTARILARGLNYETAAGGGPQIEMPELGIHCAQIMAGEHVDVLEMDAASHTSIDDIREIIEASRYRPVSARYKVYIIDEVHMLSKAAFNGLLKTLEEPPAHVKFIFATTEIRKVPVTVLSRCQRFDLRRVSQPELQAHLAMICSNEDVEAEAEALRLIAQAAEGSVRDSLSLLDQAIAHEPKGVTANGARGMLGLADRASVIDLFEAIVAGDGKQALDLAAGQVNLGVEPAQLLTDLAAINHLVSQISVAGSESLEDHLAQAELTRCRQLADQLSVRYLSRNWQMTIKGLEDLQRAPNAIQAADMILIRLCHASDLPDPDDLIRKLQAAPQSAPAPAGRAAPAAPAAPAAAETAAPQATASRALAPAQPRPEPVQSQPAPAQPAVQIATVKDLLQLAKQHRDVALQYVIEHHLRLVKLEPGQLTINLDPGHPPDAVSKLSQRLQQWTGERWMVAVSREPGEPPLAEQAARAKDRLMTDAKLDPLVARVLEQFPGAEVVDVRIYADDAPAQAPVDDIDPDAVGGDDNF